MRRTGMRLAVTVTAALTLAAGTASTAYAAADDPRNGHDSGHNKVIVRGDDNQIVLGNNNVVGRGDVTSSGHGGEAQGEGDETTAPRPPYATVHSNVSTLIERSEPRANSAEVAQIGPRTQVPVSCFVTGENIHGNTTWYRVRAENEFRTGYISAYYTNLTGSVSRCT